MRFGGGFAKIGVLCLAISCGACAEMPTSGPLSGDVKAGHPIPAGRPPVRAGQADASGGRDPARIRAERFGRKCSRSRRPPSDIVFGVGDVISVTIFEAAAGGLFIPAEAGVRPGNYVTLPEQTVDNDGNITVPYAGEIKAAGGRGRNPAHIVDRSATARSNRRLLSR